MARPTDYTQEFLHECFALSDTGVLAWKIRPKSHFSSQAAQRTFNAQFSGKEAGTERVKGSKRYRYIQIGGGFIATHRAICIMVNGLVYGHIDHINGDSLDNRIENLRDVTQQENNKNKKLTSKNKSGCVGVSWRKDSNKWVVKIGVNGKPKNLGSFVDFEFAELLAKVAYKHFGYHENHGAV